MKELMTFNNEEKRFSSLYICEQINKFRELEGNKKNLLHKSLITKIEVEFEDEITEQKILPSDYKDSSGKKNKMYELTYEQSLQLLMSESKVVRKGVIEVLKAQQKRIEELGGYEIPKTFSDALMLASKQAKEIEEKDKLLIEAKPKVDFYDAVAESKTAIDIGTAAKVLDMGIGRNTLFDILKIAGILMENNQPYQRYINRGYFRTIEQKWNKPDGSVQINIKTLVYQKGLDFIRKLIIDNS